MDALTRQRLFDRAHAVLDTGRPEMAATSFTSPVSRYTDPARLQAELATVFRRHPQVIAAAGEIARAGDWLARDLQDVPVLLTRDADGTLRAFLNVCRHRGARLVATGQGQARQFTCPYHAWTYGADGALKGLPLAFGFPGLDHAACGLKPLAVTERAGLIWLLSDPALADTNIDAQLGPLAAELESFGFASHVPYAPRQLSVACNWKLMIDGSFEAYHFKIAHRATIAAMFADNVQIIDDFGLNRRLYLVKTELATAGRTGSADLDVRAGGNIIYYFFPNTLILVQGDHAQVSRLAPTGTDTTVVHDIALIPAPPDSDKATRHWDRNVELYRRALGEDYAQMESMQSTLRSGANEALTFGTFEFAAARFHADLEAELAAAA